jgi:hypothetical protein
VVPKGYVYLLRPDHPAATADGYVLEHRLVMEDVLGRYLRPEEIVHHRNTEKGDNRPENLEVMTQADHARLEAIHHMLAPTPEGRSERARIAGRLGAAARWGKPEASS